MLTRSIALLLLLLVVGATSGADMPIAAGGKPQAADFARAWGVSAEDLGARFAKAGSLGIAQIAGSIPANILWPGDTASLTIQFTNADKRTLTVSGRWMLIAYHLTTPTEDVFNLGLEREREWPIGTVSIEVPGAGFGDVTVTVDPPMRFGGYALILELAGGKRLFAAGLARTVKPGLEPGDRFHQVAMDLNDVAAITRLRTPPNRVGVGYIPTGDPGFAKLWEREAGELGAIATTGFPVIIEFGAGADHGPQLPLGRTRPHLDGDGVMLDTKSDFTWLPAYDADFTQFVKRFALAYGWPKGPVNAMKLWNEPWAGISISGWGADDLRYREIYAALCRGVEAARAEGGVQILLGGCDSSSNTFDKLFPDGSLEFLPRLDFLSIHYQGLQPAGMVKMWRDRQAPEGRVRIWDTESWVANSADRVPGVLAGMLAAGTDRLVGIQSHSVVATPTRIRVRLPGGMNEERTVTQAWPVAPALAAFQDAIGQRHFRELLWEGLPWIFAFDGRVKAGAPDPDDQTLVVCGDIGAFFGADNAALRTCRGVAEVGHKEALRATVAALKAGDPARAEAEKALAAPEVLSGGTLTLREGPWSLLDGDGNRVAATAGGLNVPLDGSGWYLRPDGSPGSGAALLAAVRAARIEGYEPVAVVVHDPIAPLASHPTITLDLLNVLNRPLSGTLQVTAAGLTLVAPEHLDIPPHAHCQATVRIAAGVAVAANQYPLRVVFDAGSDGRAIHEEVIRVNQIAKRTIHIDGDLTDWAGVLPQAITAGGGGPTLMETAWLPMVKQDAALTNGFATAWLAADDQAFYFASRIADDTPDPGMLRFASRNEDDDFYPAVSSELDPARTTTRREVVAPAGAPAATLWEPVAKRMELDLDLPGDRLVSLACIDSDPLRRRVVRFTVTNRDGGRTLATTEVRDAGTLVWTRLRLAGKVRIAIESPNWLRADLAAVAVDPLPADAGTGAVLPEDRRTGSGFASTYGHGLLLLPGKPVVGTLIAAWHDEEMKTSYPWPEGVRRFSYRKRPELPMGAPAIHDNVQIAFNVLPDEAKPWYPVAPGTFKGYSGYWDSDYEYALNPVRDDLGGGTEVWRVRAPGLPNVHGFPHSVKAPGAGAVVTAQLVIRREGNSRIVECAIPWSEIPEVKAARDAGRPIRFSYRVNDNAGTACMELSRGRSVAKRNLSFKPDWREHWANEVEFGWEK
jgi:hypothetical protein